MLKNRLYNIFAILLLLLFNNGACNDSNEVDDLMWCDIKDVNKYIIRINNMSGAHFDNCMRFLNIEEGVFKDSSSDKGSE